MNALIRIRALAGAIPLWLALAATVLAMVFYGRNLASWSVPLRYTGDTLAYAMYVKAVLDTGWGLAANPHLGAPFGAIHLDYPVSEAANVLLVHVLGLFGEWPFVMNAYLALSYVLVALSAYWVLRQLGTGAAWSFAGAVIYAFLPFHPMRAEHLFLAAYYAVPLSVWLAWWAWRAGFEAGTDPVRPWVILAIGFVVGSSGIYYAFFACFLICVAMLGRLSSRATLRRCTLALAVVIAAVAANTLPNIVYKLRNGPNPEVAVRPFSDTERYGLKVIQLVLPRPDHRFKALGQVNEKYSQVSETINENATASLGLFGTAGFVLLLLGVLRRPPREREGAGPEPAYLLSGLNLACILLGTVGGLGALFSLLISAQIRSYNRISVVIAFLAVAALVAWLDRFTSPARMRPRGKWLMALAVTAFAVVEQTSPSDYKQIPGSFASDQAFVRQVEAGLPPAALVLQMPFHRYPEEGEKFEMENYGPIRGYLHSERLRWSYGHMKGREGDRWMRALAELPVAQQLSLAAESGFGAVVIDRRGFEDRGRAVEAQLGKLLGPARWSSRDEHLVAYATQPTGNTPVALDRLIPEFQELRMSQPRPPASVTALSGFGGPEPWGRWTLGPRARIETAKPLPERFTLEIQTAMALARNADEPLRVIAGGIERSFVPGSKETLARLEFTVPPGTRAIDIVVPAPISPAEIGLNTDTRLLGVGIASITLRAAR